MTSYLGGLITTGPDPQQLSAFNKFASSSASRNPPGVADYINTYLFGHDSTQVLEQAPLGAYNPDISGYTFIIMQPPHLSGMPKDVQQSVDDICKNIVFFGLEFTPPAITINTEAVNTQASVSMAYATTKVATGEINITYLDNSNQDINSLHNIWIEYIYNQLWGDIKPDPIYIDPTNESFGALDYATSLYVLKYDATMDGFDTLPSMVGKATGIFPLGLPVKEVLGTRATNELTMQNINYTCSYFEVVHPKSQTQVYSTTADNKTIWDEAKGLLAKYNRELVSVDTLSKANAAQHHYGPSDTLPPPK